MCCAKLPTQLQLSTFAFASTSITQVCGVFASAADACVCCTFKVEPLGCGLIDSAFVLACVLQELRRAAEAAVLLTHPSDTAADAAAVLAAAIAWCLRCASYATAQVALWYCQLHACHQQSKTAEA
jgi:ADP-ribosylglycohydrolase